MSGALLSGSPPAAPTPAPFRGDTISRLSRCFPQELIPMDDTARQNALRALQRSLDRRDNGGSTGHEVR